MTALSVKLGSSFKRLGQWAVNLLGSALALLWSIPVIWALIASFRPAADAMSRAAWSCCSWRPTPCGTAS